MKKIIQKNLFKSVASKAMLAVSGGLIMVSCGTQMGGYSETDGVYYDPNKDTLPEGVIIDQQGNRVGEYYDYQNNASVIENSNENIAEKKNRYDNWNTVSPSDWGSYAGTETNYYSDYWGSPWGYYSPWGWGSGFGMSFGWGSSWGWYNPYMNWGWGSPYGWGGYYSPFYYGYYNPYFGYNPYYGYYSPYYGYYGGNYGYYGNPYRYQRSGADGRSYNTYQQNQGTMLNKNGNSAFRNNATSTRVQNQVLNSSPARYRNVPSGNVRGQQPRIYQNTQEQMQQPRRIQQPRQMQEPRQMDAPRNYEPRTRSNDSGFRSGGDSGFRNSGGFGGSSSGGSRSGGGTRSGGFR